MEVQSLLPQGLTVDTFPDHSGKERAWVGLVPFHMSGIRFGPLPPVPGFSAFCETNVRTYACHEQLGPGVWFFSLDAANTVACRFAQCFYGLNYVPARMSFARMGNRVDYWSERRGMTSAFAQVSASVEGDGFAAEPGTLEFFLVERYVLFANRGGILKSARVWHDPYQLRQVVPGYSVSEGIVASNGIEPRPWEHALFSDKVQVEIFPLK